MSLQDEIKTGLKQAISRENEKKIREDIANAVVAKIAEMCGCRNCMIEIEQIIKGERKPFENQCAECTVDCSDRIKE